MFACRSSPCSPVQPPLAVQLVALVDDHVSVDDFRLVIDVGLAESVAVGTGVPACVVALAVLELPEMLPAASVART